MSFLSKIVPTWFSATNENTVALANVKFDFTLVKLDPPAEFNPLGGALTVRRKQEAENEGPHKTARRLGALFEQAVPPTPKLISAYGKRVSEIIQKPGINPEGSSSHGPFQSFVGADATAMWAAATSGIASITVYMLACIIVRLLDPKEAISLWVELVKERKEEIHEAFAQNSIATESSLLSTQQDISRDDLAVWDNSARSWIRSADEAKSLEKEQLRLILDNLNIPHCTGNGTYQKLMTLWKEALTGVECLLNGSPQMALTKSVPMALLSWHMFPDLIILSTEIKHASFQDSAFPPSAKLTLGCATVNNQNSMSMGTKWSLALSHLQFYGRAVEVKTKEDESRITVEQALVATLGALVAAWEIPARDFPAMQVIATWFNELGCVLFGHGVSFKDLDSTFPDSILWLQPLLEAAQLIKSGDTDEQSRKDLSQLFHFGRRNCKRFLVLEEDNAASTLPFFGLCNPSVARGLIMGSSEECSLAYLRDIAQRLGLERGDCILLYLRNEEEAEVLTALPGGQPRTKRDSDSQDKESSCYHRWISNARYQDQTEIAYSDEEDFDEEDHWNYGLAGESDQFTVDWKFSYSRLKNHSLRADEAHLEGSLKGRLQGTQNLFQGVEVLQASYKAKARSVFTWIDPPEEFVCEKNRKENRAEKKGSVTEDFIMIEGSNFIGGVGLYVRPALVDSMRSRKEVKHKTEGLEQSSGWFRYMNRDMLIYYLSERSVGKHLFPGHMGIRFDDFTNARRNSLRAIAIARYLYRAWPDATLSTKVFLSGNIIGKVKWAQALSPTNISADSLGDGSSRRSSRFRGLVAPRNVPSQASSIPSRPVAFACVIYMDSGTLDIEPRALTDAIAISRENYIYVAAEALDDPFPSPSPFKSILRRLIGNIGHSGTSILVTPKQPLTREISTSYKAVEHKLYDDIRRDSFKGTSLHLHFTGWKTPLVLGKGHTIDDEVQYREAVVSVLDKGDWVADLDVLQAAHPNTCDFECQCSDENSLFNRVGGLVSLDNWEEVLDAPPSEIGVFRADGNWAARLAAVCVLAQKGFLSQTIVVPSGSFCSTCLQRVLLSQPKTKFVIH